MCKKEAKESMDQGLKLMLLQQRMKISTGIGFLRSPELTVLSALSDVRSEAKLDRLIWLDWRFTRCVGLIDPELGAYRAPWPPQLEPELLALDELEGKEKAKDESERAEGVGEGGFGEEEEEDLYAAYCAYCVV